MVIWLLPPTDDGAACPGGQEPLPRPGWGLICRLHQAHATLHHGTAWHDQPCSLHRYGHSSAESRVQGSVGVVGSGGG